MNYLKSLIIALAIFAATSAGAVDRIRLDFDSPAAPTDMVASSDFRVWLDAEVAARNAQITAQNVIEAAKTPPGVQAPLVTANQVVLSLIKPIVDGTERAAKETSVRAGIDKVQGGTPAQRAAFRTWVTSNIP